MNESITKLINTFAAVGDFALKLPIFAVTARSWSETFGEWHNRYYGRPFLDQFKLPVTHTYGHTCKCQGVLPGSYDNQIWVHPPAHMPKANGYCLDLCIAEEVMQLWMRGITTTGCCCGHQTHPAYIGVAFEDIPRMKQLGYQVQLNPCRPGDQDSFQPRGLDHIKRQPLES